MTYLWFCKILIQKKFVFQPIQKLQILAKMNIFEFCTVHNFKSRNLLFLQSPKCRIFMIGFFTPVDILIVYSYFFRIV